MPGSDVSLSRAADSQDSMASIETGTAMYVPPSSPPIVEGEEHSSKVQPVQRRNRMLSRADSTDSMLFSASSVGPLASTVTDIDGLPQDQVASMRAVFNMFDQSGDGIIQAHEVGAILRRLNLVTSRRLVNKIIEIVDIDGDGELQFDEFVTLMARVKDEVDHNDAEHATDDGDDTIFMKQSPEEKAAKRTRQLALSAFQRAVTQMAFTHLSSNDDALFTELLKVLSKPPTERTEWELQRLLLWTENAKTGSSTAGFKFILELPSQEESDVRIEVCRCMTVTEVKADDTIMKQGDKGECMYIIMKGEVEVLAEENGSEKHLAYMATGGSFGDIAIMADDEADQVRTATIRAREDSVLGVLSRDDYRRHILRMQQEAKAEVVEMMRNVPYLSRVSRGDLLRMAMMFRPTKYYRGELIAQQKAMPEAVIFLTSGDFVISTATDDDSDRREINVMQVSVGSTIEPVGLHMIFEEQTPYRRTLRAATTCEGWAVGRNVAKRVLNKRHVLQGLQEHNEMMEKLIQKRVDESKAGDAVRCSLGFTPRKVQSMLEKAVGSRRIPQSPDEPKTRVPATPSNKDYRRGSVYVPEAKDQQADEQRKLMAMANYARHHPHRQPLHVAKAPRSLPAPMVRDISTVAFGKSIRKPGIASHEDQELIWHLPDEDVPAGGSAAGMEVVPASVASRASMSTTARLASAASANTAITQAASEATTNSGTPRGTLGPPRDDMIDSGKRKAAKLKPVPPPRMLSGAARSRGQVVLGGVGIRSSRGLAQDVPRAAPSTPTSAQRLSGRAHFQGRPVSMSRAGHGFEMKDPVPILLDPGGSGGGGRGGGGETAGGGARIRSLRNRTAARHSSARKRMGVSARGPHSVRAHSRASTAVTSSAG